jgi:vancomycin permeability regulator SanA
MKRTLLSLMLAVQLLGYKVLTEGRYEGQGLTTIYFRLSTMSDILSIAFTGSIVVLIIAAIIHPERISLGRTVAVAIFSAILLWLDFGVRRTPPNEFEPEAAIALLGAMWALTATLLTRSRGHFRAMQRVLRILRNTILIALVIVAFTFFYAFFFPTYSRTDEITDFNADAGVVLGAAVWRGHGLGDRPSPALRERIEIGYDQLTKHAIPRIVVTGASAPGELAEAEVAKMDLVRRGVDPSQVIEETFSHTTLEQVRYLHDELYLRQNWSRFVIISDQYHLARVVEMCRFNGLHAVGSPSRIRQPFMDLLYYRLRESLALLEYWMLGR